VSDVCLGMPGICVHIFIKLRPKW